MRFSAAQCKAVSEMCSTQNNFANTSAHNARSALAARDDLTRHCQRTFLTSTSSLKPLAARHIVKICCFVRTDKSFITLFVVRRYTSNLLSSTKAPIMTLHLPRERTDVADSRLASNFHASIPLSAVVIGLCYYRIQFIVTLWLEIVKAEHCINGRSGFPQILATSRCDDIVLTELRAMLSITCQIFSLDYHAEEICPKINLNIDFWCGKGFF